MPTHADTKKFVEETLPSLSDKQRLALRAVAWHETKYGEGWKPPGVGSNNWGAVTTKDSANGFEYGDSRFDQTKGGVVQYKTYFRKYASPSEGVLGLASVLLKPNVVLSAEAGNLRGVASAMRDNNYYLGIASSRSQQITDYETALRRALVTITKATGEPNSFLAREGSGSGSQSSPPPGGSSPKPSESNQAPLFLGNPVELPNLVLGSHGPSVVLWQRLCNRRGAKLEQDGKFGPVTRAATIRIQRTLGLATSGIVSSKDWIAT